MHIDVKYLPQMPDEIQRCYLFVAIDRATRWVFVQIRTHKTAAAARAFLAVLSKAAPFKLRTLLTDHGSEFTEIACSTSRSRPAASINLIDSARHWVSNTV